MIFKFRFLLWLSRKWHDFKDSRKMHLKTRQEWRYTKGGDTRRDI